MTAVHAQVLDTFSHSLHDVFLWGGSRGSSRKSRWRTTLHRVEEPTAEPVA